MMGATLIVSLFLGLYTWLLFHRNYSTSGIVYIADDVIGCRFAVVECEGRIYSGKYRVKSHSFPVFLDTLRNVAHLKKRFHENERASAGKKLSPCRFDLRSLDKKWTLSHLS